MLKEIKLSLIIIILYVSSILAQEKKSVEALYLEAPLTIDGALDEPVYGKMSPAGDFVQRYPYNGQPSKQPTEVYLFYDQTAIYLGAMLYDSAPDSIFNFFSERDVLGASDYFGIYIDPYNQGQLAYGFFVTPANVQTDVKAYKSESDNEDITWNAIWESKTRVTEKGWVVEMRIPYAAIRFSGKVQSTWGLNMFRHIRRYNSSNSWNFIDRKALGFIHQEGQLTGITNVRPPIRLSLSPYGAMYMEYADSKQSHEFVYKGGMDLKYGLSKSFTLDMMLIPDFGQIQSDDNKLNLSPYELYYDEKRQFFTEGTELFERGNIFYSRRIGADPKFTDKAYETLSPNEIVDFIPNETPLLNITKVSGRTTKGWGLGLLNAMTMPSYAKLKDTTNNDDRKVLVQPFTNYNVSVVDKSLKNNSYISIINTNVAMFNDPFGANVTATEFQLRNNSKTYALTGKAGISTRGEANRNNGYFSQLGLTKIKGKFRFGISQDICSDKYNPNDLGYLKRNNFLLTQSHLTYVQHEPFWLIREYRFELWWNYYRVYNPNTILSSQFWFNGYILFKNNYSFYTSNGFETDNYNYYEPRVKGRYFVDPYYYWYNISLTTDKRKPVNIYLAYGGYWQPTTNQSSNWGEVNMNIRMGHRLQIDYGLCFDNKYNNWGYADKTSDNDTIYFALRSVKTIDNILAISYAINNKVSISGRIRHYWSGADDEKYLQLKLNGSLEDDPSYTKNLDDNYNAFNIDMIFRWIFAPGSELSLAWKNFILNDQNIVTTNYWDNMRDTWSADQTNSLSLKILYYLDYNSIKRKKK